MDLFDPMTDRSVHLTEVEKEWLLIICPADFVFRKGNVIDIQAYTPSQLTVQIGFSQGVVRSHGYLRRRYRSLQDASNAWEFAVAFDKKAHFWYRIYHKENNYMGVFVKWHANSCLAIKAGDHHLMP